MAFPEVGLRVVLDLGLFSGPMNQLLRNMKSIEKVTKQTAKSVDESGRRMTTSFQRFGDIAKNLPKDLTEFTNVFTHLRSIWEDMGKPKIDVTMFDELVEKGTDISTAFRAAAGDTDALSNQFSFLGASLSQTAIVAGAAVFAFRSLFKVIKQGVKDFEELTLEARLLRLEIGGTTNEAAAWAHVAARAGVSTRSLQTVIAQLEKNLIDTELRLARGEESSTQFTRAWEALTGQVFSAQDALRPASEIIEELAMRFDELGPGAYSSGLAMALFGRSGRQVLPILFAMGDGLREAEQESIRLGTAISRLDEDLGEQSRIAGVELKAAWKGLTTVIGRIVIPVWNELREVGERVLVTIRQMTILALAGTAAISEIFSGGGFAEAKQAAEDTFGFLSGLGTETSRAAEQAKNAIDEYGQQAARTAEQQRLLNERLREAQDEMDELADTYRRRRGDLVLQFGEEGELGGRRWEDIMLRRRRQMEDAALSTFRRLQDIFLRYNQRREDIIRRHGRRQQEMEEDARERIIEFERDAQRRREELAREHSRRLRDINQDYLDTVDEAARRNDAVAVVRAIRERARQTRDENQRYRDEQGDLRRNLDEKRRQIDEQNKKQRQEQRDRLQEQLDDLKINFDRQQEALKRSLENQRIDREIAWRRQQEDFNRAKKREFDDLRMWYDREKALQQQKIDELIAQGAQQIIDGAPVIAKAVGAAIGTIMQAAAEEMIRQQEWLNRHRYWYQPGQQDGGRQDRRDPWVDRHRYFRQEGGLDVVSGPTSFMFGEGGAEAVLSVPLQGRVTHHHQFSPLSVGFDGLPGGMNTEQIAGIVYQVVAGLARDV